MDARISRVSVRGGEGGIDCEAVLQVTVAVIGQGKAELQSKGKLRTVYFSRRLCQALQAYARERKIESGPCS